jgi:hypothetical protein
MLISGVCLSIVTSLGPAVKLCHTLISQQQWIFSYQEEEEQVSEACDDACEESIIQSKLESLDSAEEAESTDTPSVRQPVS